MTGAEIASIKLALANASWWTEWCTIAVAFGVFIEFVALFIFSKEMPKPEKGVMGIATAIIVLGCAGEYIFDKRRDFAATQFQDAFDEQIASLKTEAKVAEKDAVEAKLALARYKAPRNLSSEQRSSLALKMAVYPGTEFEVFIQPDSEATDLLENIENALSAAHWTEKPLERDRLKLTHIHCG